MTKSANGFYELLERFDLDEAIWSNVCFDYQWYDDGNFHSYLKRSGIKDTRSYLRAYVIWRKGWLARMNSTKWEE